MKGQGRIIGIDLLEMTGLNHVDFMQGDFTEDSALAKLESLLAGHRVDLVLSDMAPNITVSASPIRPALTTLRNWRWISPRSG
jgi:23S rRNA (uridine2552-2'-O)-methyltransferase